MEKQPSYLEIFVLSFRLHRIMKETNEKYMNVSRMLKEIQRVNVAANTKCGIGRQALEKLIHNPSQVSLSMSNLAALDIFLRSHGEGLDQHPLLEKTGPLDWLARSPCLTWMLASKPSAHAHQEEISSWDFRSNIELQKILNGMGARFKHGNETFLVPPRSHQDVLQQQKLDNLVSGGIYSFISVGSPLACPGSERLLAKMFCVAPFGKPSLAHPLPFYFLWPPHYTRQLESSFALTADQLPNDSLGQAIRAGKASALKVGSDYYRVPLDQKRKYSLYGIIAVQRRANGEVWIVLAGLSGPATLAAAYKLKDFPAALPALPGQNSPILWAVVEADVLVDDSRDVGENRTLVDSRIIKEPQEWKVAG